MKKHLLYVSTCAVFLVLTASSFALPLVQPVRTIEIPYTGCGNPNIDGIADTIYSPEQTTEAFNATGSTGEDDDFTFSFKVAWNPRYLYVVGNILDDFNNSVSYTTTPNAREYDNVEVYISLDTIGSMYPTTNGYDNDSNCVQLRLCRGIDSIQICGRATQEEWIYHWENTASGWLFEVAIPWTAALGEEQNWLDILDYLELIHGFDVIGNDSDIPGPGHIDCQTAWDMDDPSDPEDRTEDNAWTDRSVFGIMTLGGDPTDCPWGEGGVNEKINSNIRFYPNPGRNSIHFEQEGLNIVRIYSLEGVKLIEVETTGEVDITGLKSGIYLAEINGNSFVKFIKE